MKVAAFFDLDGTLIGANTAALWMKRERKHKRITFFQQMQAIFYIICYRFGVIDIENVTIKALKTVKGLSEDVVRNWTHAWFREDVIPYAFQEAIDIIEKHRSEGHKLILLTSASVYESEAATEFFKLDSFLCSRYEVKNGFFTGDIIRPVCYGEGKVYYAEKYARREGVDLGISYFYTDSITDMPMLLRVGNPCVVNPDFRLKREARKRGWVIYNWHLSKNPVR